MYAKLETLWTEMIKEAERSSKIDENIILNKENWFFRKYLRKFIIKSNVNI